MPTLEEHAQAYHNAKQAGDEPAAALIMQRILQAEKAKALKGAAEDSNASERAWANAGAGFDSLIEGVKQVLPGVKGASDAEIREKRERDAALSQATDLNLAPDWAPTFGSALQVVGETAPTLVLPGVGAAGKLAEFGLTKALPRATGAAKALARASGTGTVGGGVGGALMPVTSDESRLGNTVLSAAGGAVLPAAGAAWQAGKRLVGGMTAGGGRARAGTVLRESLGATADDVARAADARAAERRMTQPQSVQDIPESLAEATGSVPAAMVESSARRGAETMPGWADFVEAQNATRFNALMDATSEAGTYTARKAARDAATGPQRRAALSAAEQDPLFAVPAFQATEQVAISPRSANPAVQDVVNYVRGQIGADAKIPISPERLYEVRKVLVKKLGGPALPGDNLAAATKGARRETMNIVAGIDDALDQASGGRWSRYMNRYQSESPPVNAARAADAARAVFTDTNIPLVGGAPEVTLPRINAMQRAGQSGFDRSRTDFSPRAQDTLQATADQYVRATEPARVRKLTGTQGGGPQTSTDIDAALSMLTKRRGAIASAVEYLTSGSNLAMRAEVSRLLRNPTEAAAAIRAAAQRGIPLSAAQQVLLDATARVAGAGTVGALSE